MQYFSCEVSLNARFALALPFPVPRALWKCHKDIFLTHSRVLTTCLECCQLRWALTYTQGYKYFWIFIFLISYNLEYIQLFV